MSEQYQPPVGGGVSYINPEAQIDNIVEQIDPKQVLNGLDHALRGEFFDREKNKWVKENNGKPLVNDSCRGQIMSFLTPILTNNTTMSNISNEREFSNLMLTIIETVAKRFRSNLEEYGFVPPGKGFVDGRFENKGTPDSSRMTQVSNMIYMVCFHTLSRARNGMESRKLFASLSMVDNLSGGSMGGETKKRSLLSRFFGKDQR